LTAAERSIIEGPNTLDIGWKIPRYKCLKVQVNILFKFDMFPDRVAVRIRPQFAVFNTG